MEAANALIMMVILLEFLLLKGHNMIYWKQKMLTQMMIMIITTIITFGKYQMLIQLEEALVVFSMITQYISKMFRILIILTFVVHLNVVVVMKFTLLIKERPEMNFLELGSWKQTHHFSMKAKDCTLKTFSVPELTLMFAETPTAEVDLMLYLPITLVEEETLLVEKIETEPNLLNGISKDIMTKKNLQTKANVSNTVKPFKSTTISVMMLKLELEEHGLIPVVNLIVVVEEVTIPQLLISQKIEKEYNMELIEQTLGQHFGKLVVNKD